MKHRDTAKAAKKFQDGCEHKADSTDGELYLGSDLRAAFRAGYELAVLDQRAAIPREPLMDVTAHLAAAISLLRAGGKAAKKAAPSDKMFDRMMRDYQDSLDRARRLLREATGGN